MNSRKGKYTENGALDVAVIGLSCKFPQAMNLYEFWENLKQGKESIEFFSRKELEDAGISADLLDDPNYVRAWGILEGIEYFDAQFFGYTPFEAESMDPQIRLAHECVYEALEDAGYIADVEDNSVGLYFAASSNPIWEWSNLSSFTLDSSNIAQLFNASLFSSKDFLSTRISYKLNLKGPSYVMNTACSSSLVALHIAARALLLGECDMAVAGGVSIGGISIPTLGKTGYLYQEGLIVSPDGHCKAFDAESKGTVGGNGVGAVVLKRLNEAIKDRDNIYAVIKGSAINNDGNRKVAYTAPSVEGQAEVLKMAQRMAKVPPESINYIEAHGTGTQLGDPIEIEGIRLAFNTDKRNFCAIGTVKSNIGHLNSAAGVAGFIKTVLSLKHRMIPPSLHFKKPNPKIDFSNTPLYVNTALKELTNEDSPLRAGVSSFGVGGTNAHVILQEYDSPETQFSEKPWQILLLSAKTEKGLLRKTSDLKSFLRVNTDTYIGDAAYTLAIGRQHFYHRKFLLCSDSKNAIEELSSSNTGPNFQALNCKNRKVVLLFPDYGMQYINMSLELYKTEIVFHKELNHCFDLFKTKTAVDLANILFPDTKNIKLARQRIMTPSIARPLVFIIEYALAQLLLKWGIKVSAMIGCGIGEYVAACLAGVFKLEDAFNLLISQSKAKDNAPITQISELSLKKNIGPLTLNEPEIPFISSATGDWIRPEDAKHLQYWLNKDNDRMSYKNSISEISKKDDKIILQIGPGSVCSDFQLSDDISRTKCTFLSLIRSMDEDASDAYILLQNIGKLWTSGIDINWEAFYSTEKRRRISMPTYPFERKRYWRLMEQYERLHKNPN